MKIKFLGTSHGVPETTRRCTSVLLEASGCHYLIDAGAPIADELTRAGVAFADIRAVFITHLHGDHVDGLVQFTDLCNWYYRTAQPTFFTPDIALKNALDAWQTAIEGKPLREYEWNEIQEGEIYADEAIRVTAIRTRHQDIDQPNYRRYSYAFSVEECATGRRILFTGDLIKDMSDMPAAAFDSDYDCIVTEAAHGRLTELVPVLEKCRTKHLIVSHIFHRTNPPESLEALRAVLPMQTTVAEDGNEFDI